MDRIKRGKREDLVEFLGWCLGALGWLLAAIALVYFVLSWPPFR